MDAELLDANNQVNISTKNVSALTLNFQPGRCPLDMVKAPVVRIDDQKLTVAPVPSDRSWSIHFLRDGKKWKSSSDLELPPLAKRHGLQGPIDDAFMDSFADSSPERKR